MTGRNVIVKKFKKVFWTQCKKFFTFTEKSSKTKWFHSVMTSMTMCLLNAKTHMTLYRFNQYRSYTDFDIKLDGFIPDTDIGLDFLNNYEINWIQLKIEYCSNSSYLSCLKLECYSILTTKLNRFLFGCKQGHWRNNWVKSIWFFDDFSVTVGNF